MILVRYSSKSAPKTVDWLYYPLRVQRISFHRLFRPVFGDRKIENFEESVKAAWAGAAIAEFEHVKEIFFSPD